ncbi:MAG TPA: methyltransferase type 11 [Alphaproteobacteria bacterium]|nr:methyltransferase type 11 [Alphaproteobacteria bacterium]
MEYRTEDGTVIGNVDKKYESRNPIARALMNGFLSSFDDLVRRAGVTSVHEVGCGEGHLSARLARMELNVRSSDFSRQIVEQAASLNPSPRIKYSVRSIYDLNPETDKAPLVVCCEVLEHLEQPLRGLQQLSKITGEYCLLSVPREPVWRILNMARGKYLRDFGNTPGHIQHWGKKSFAKFVSQQFEVIEIRSPLPWTMLLCRPYPA